MIIESREKISPAVIDPAGFTIRPAGTEGFNNTSHPKTANNGDEEGLIVLSDEVFASKERLAEELSSLGFKVPHPLVGRVRIPGLLTGPKIYIMVGAAFIITNH